MDKTELKELFLRLDSNTLERRTERLSQFDVLQHPGEPELLFNYMVDAKWMFVNGHFMGAVLVCAGIVEMILAHQIRDYLKMGLREVERFNLNQMVVLARRLDILNDNEVRQIDGLRKLRNQLAHANDRQLRKRAKGSGWPLKSEPPASSYLHPFYRQGLEQDSLEHLREVRKLIARLYPAEE